MYKDYDEAIPRNTKLSEKNIDQFVKVHRIPNLDILTEENLQTYLDSGIPLAIFYYEKDIQYEKHKADLYHISKLYRDRLYFVATKTFLKDKNKFNKELNFGIYDPQQPDFFYSIEKGKRLNQRNLVQFGEAYFRNEVVPQILNEPIKGRVYENHVVVLDEKNYDEIVLDEDRDVAVLYYSPECRYSQKVNYYNYYNYYYFYYYYYNYYNYYYFYVYDYVFDYDYYYDYYYILITIIYMYINNNYLYFYIFIYVLTYLFVYILYHFN